MNGVWRCASALKHGLEPARPSCKLNRQSNERDRRYLQAITRPSALQSVNVTLLKALVALMPACILFAGSVLLFLKGRTVFSFLQLLGAGCLVVVGLTHICEALNLFPWMHWGLEHGLGHYLDSWSAVLGRTLFPIGYLLRALRR